MLDNHVEVIESIEESASNTHNSFVIYNDEADIRHRNMKDTVLRGFETLQRDIKQFDRANDFFINELNKHVGHSNN